MNKIFICLIITIGIFASCQKDYLIDGGKAPEKVNMTTYDFLKSNPIFDSLIYLIDKVGLKDKVNGSVTFMVPTDYSLKLYLNNVLSDMRVKNPTATYGINDIPIDTLMKIETYLFSGSITREKLTKEGTEYVSLFGERRKISLEPREEYVNYLSDKPEYIFFYKKKGSRWDDFDQTDLGKKEQDISVRVRTSGIISNTGVIHVLQGDHVMFFYEKKY